MNQPQHVSVPSISLETIILARNLARRGEGWEDIAVKLKISRELAKTVVWDVGRGR